MKIQSESALNWLKTSNKPFLELFRHGSLSVEIYKPEKVDLQQPHDRDEVYFVASGTGQFVCGGSTTDFKTGDFLFVPAHTEHRFLNFSEDFSTWVIFYGADGGEVAADEVQILGWQPAFQPAFFQLNKQWIEVDYPLEPLDIAVLSDPEKYILAGGGRILSAVLAGEVVGVVALRKLDSGEVELTKMAVDVRLRGKRIGEKLMQAALDEARAMGLRRIILFSNRNTSAPAVNLYRKMGWQEIELQAGLYKRANIKMEHLLGFDKN